MSLNEKSFVYGFELKYDLAYQGATYWLFKSNQMSEYFKTIVCYGIWKQFQNDNDETAVRTGQVSKSMTTS